MLRNTPRSFGSLSRALHWLTALLILSAIALGLYAGDLPRDTDAQVAVLARVYSLHKTIGVATLFVAALRILWTVTQPRPAPLHPERRVETFLAAVVHWALWGAMLVVPLSGWIKHAALTGFAPILWPLGQGLPLVPRGDAVAQAAGLVHFLGTRVLFAALLLHVAGALKHGLIDRDGTLTRMLTGRAGGGNGGGGAVRRHGPAAALGLLLWLAVLSAGILAPAGSPEPAAAAPAPAIVVSTPAPLPDTARSPGAAPAWAMTGGSLGIEVRQMGAAVQGDFAQFDASIAFDPAIAEGPAGRAAVRIELASLRLGGVTQQALDAGFLDAAAWPDAVFEGQILAAGGSHRAEGTLTLRGQTVPLTIPLKIAVSGNADIATATGTVTLDRRDFGVGTAYADESTVGYPVAVTLSLEARRQ